MKIKCPVCGSSIIVKCTEDKSQIYHINIKCDTNSLSKDIEDDITCGVSAGSNTAFECNANKKHNIPSEMKTEILKLIRMYEDKMDTL